MGYMVNDSLKQLSTLYPVYPPIKALLPFQKTAIEETIHFLLTNEAHACYNACEMGLGKTIQAIVAVNSLDCKNVLIICPAIMRLVWRDELNAWRTKQTTIHTLLTGKDVDALVQKSFEKDYYRQNNFVIVSYDLASTSKFVAWASAHDWEMLILDESHYLKNTKAKRTKAVLQQIWPHAHYKLALSGTPFTTRIVDGYTLFKRMLPNRWKDFDSFADEFSYKRIKHINGRTITDYFGVRNAPELRKLLRENFYVRYTKEEVLTQLPPKQYTKITLPYTYAVVPKSKNQAEQLRLDALMVKQALVSNTTFPIPSCLAEHRRLQGEKKAKAVIEFTQNLLEQNIPVVLFAWHKNVVNLFKDAFAQYRPAVITGETPATTRASEVVRFQSGDTSLFIGNIVAAGTGITLTASSTVVLAELDWSPTTVSQAIDRCHRIGQKDQVNVYYFVVENSLDEIIDSIVMSRAQVFKNVLDGE